MDEPQPPRLETGQRQLHGRSRYNPQCALLPDFISVYVRPLGAHHPAIRSAFQCALKEGNDMPGDYLYKVLSGEAETFEEAIARLETLANDLMAVEEMTPQGGIALSFRRSEIHPSCHAAQAFLVKTDI
jgi:hypothetical protein